MKTVSDVIAALEKLEDNVKGVSASTALSEIAVFLRCDLPNVILTLKDIEAEGKHVGTDA